jgi:hypothetical protein
MPRYEMQIHGTVGCKPTTFTYLTYPPRNRMTAALRCHPSVVKDVSMRRTSRSYTPVNECEVSESRYGIASERRATLK